MRPALPCLAALLLLLSACGVETDPPTPEAPPAPPAEVSAVPPEQPPADPAPPDAPLAPIGGGHDPEEVAQRPERLQLSLGGCGGPGCPIVVLFSAAMIPEAKVGSAPARSLQPELEPATKGSWSWRSPRELLFTPAKGAFGWGHEVSVSLREATALSGEPALAEPFHETLQVPFFSVGGKVAAWPVLAGKPRLVAVLDGHTGEIGSGPRLLLFDQPVEPSWLRRRLVVSAGADTVPVKLRRPSAAELPFDELVDPSGIVAVTLRPPPADGTRLVLAWDGFEEAGESRVEVPLTVRTRFELSSHGPRDGERGRLVPVQGSYTLHFSAPVGARQLREHVAIEPAPEELSIGAWEGDAELSLRLTPGVKYRVKVDGALPDLLGNRLGKAAVIKLQARDLPPQLLAPAEPTPLERHRATLPLRARNVGKLTASVVRLASPEAFARALQLEPQQRCASYETAGSARVLPLLPGPGKENELAQLELPLEAALSAGPARQGGGSGLLCVELTATGRGSEAAGELRQVALVQLSDLALTTKLHGGGALVWVTRLRDGAPVGGVQVSLLSGAGEVEASGVTDPDGIVELAVPGLLPGGKLAAPLRLLAVAAGDAAVATLADDRLSRPWQFGLPGETAGAELRAALFTDRGVYRPEETVHVKALLGDAEGGALRLKLQDPRGQQLLDQALELDEVGGADLEVALKAQAPVGEWSLTLSRDGRETVRHFRVEEYRVPTFEVKVESSELRRGSEGSAQLRARYLHGGELSGREVRWRVERAVAPFAPAAFPGFRFSAPQAEAPVGTVAEGTARLDGSGKLAVRFPVDHASSAGPMRYVLEASVTDVDRQAYAGRLSRTVHPAAFYVGVRPPRNQVIDAGQELEVPIVAVRPDGTPLAGVEVRAQLVRVDTHTVARLAGQEAQLLNRPVATAPQPCRARTTGSAVICRFAVPQAGQYSFRAWAEDLEHQQVQAGFDVTAGGSEPVAWPRFDRDRIELVADRPSYRAGDVARLVVQTPFREASGLLTLERGGVLTHRLFRIDGDTPALEVPITAGMAPNVFASVVLVRGRIHDERDATGFPTGAPAFKLGYARLQVEPLDQRLSVEVVPAVAVTAPGTTVPVRLGVRDAAGVPVTGRATVMVVDEAVLGLTGHRTPDPVAQLFAPFPLGVRTGESRLELPFAVRARNEALFPAGDGGEGFGLSDFPAELRSLFRSTALFLPAVVLDAAGQATVDVVLPDNVTSWRVMVVAAGARGRSGSAQARVVARKPLLVQAVAPRFVYPGDTLQIAAQVVNGTAEVGTVTVRAGFSGLTLTGPAEQQAALAAGGTTLISFPVTATGSGQAIVRLSASSGGHEDAVELKLPILTPGLHRTVVESRQVAEDDVVRVKLPADRQPGTAKLEVVASTTSLSELKGAVAYLMNYPNGCIEQTTSTAYPLLVLRDLLPEMGVTVDQAQLQKFSEAGVKRILSFQTSAGGLAYWPGSDQPHAFATAFGLTALIEGKKRGYDVPDEALAKTANYLEASLRKGQISGEMPHGAMADGDTRALFVLQLGRLGRPQPGYVATLAKERAKLTPFGLSFLAVAAQEQGGDPALVAELLAEVQKAAEQTPDEAFFAGNPSGGWSMDSPLRTHAGALLAFASAAPRGSSLDGKLLTGLLRRQRGGMWGNTQENVFGIMAVARLAGSPSAGGTQPELSLEVGGKVVGAAQLEEVSRRVRRLRLSEEELGLSAGAESEQTVRVARRSAGPMFLTVRAEWDAQLTPENRAAFARGFTVTRRYETLDGSSLEGKVIPLGSVVRVRLGLQSAAAAHYVALDDKLPAGLEPMNGALATTEKISAGELGPKVAAGLPLLSYSESRDARVAFFVDELPAGAFEYVYLARATTPGRFLRPPAHAEAMYAPEVAGSTALDEVEVR